MARTSRRAKLRPDPPVLPSFLEPAPAVLGPGDVWDGVVLSGARLTDVVISGSSADLAVLRMARASFLLAQDTSLRGADLYEFTAADSALLRCDLSGADLDRAALAGTDLHGSTLDDVSGALALRGCRIAPGQVVATGAALLDALGIRVTERG